MKKLLLAALLLATTPAFADEPAAAVEAFYAVYGPLHVKGGGIPDATTRVRYAPVLSPRLNKQLVSAAAAQARLTAKVKNAAPPMLAGDIFSSLFEGARTWKIGACQVTGGVARCPVTLGYAPPLVAGRKAEKPFNWNDTVLLVATPQGWKVDDVIYDAGYVFGNTGRLSSMLDMVDAANL